MSVCVLTPAALPLAVDTWVLADLMKKMRRTETPAGSRRGRAAVRALWQRARRNPNSGHPVLYGDIEAQKKEGHGSYTPPRLYHHLASQQERNPEAKDGEEARKEHCFLDFPIDHEVMSLLWLNMCLLWK